MANPIPAMIGGATGGITVVGVHESVRRVRKDAPRSDVLGRRGIEAMMKAVGRKPPGDPTLQRVSIASGLISDAALYALVGQSLRRAIAVGSLTGAGTVLLPKPLGLGSDATARRPSTAIMTLTWYTLGALAAWGAATLAGKVMDTGEEHGHHDGEHAHHEGHQGHEASDAHEEHGGQAHGAAPGEHAYYEADD